MSIKRQTGLHCLIKHEANTVADVLSTAREKEYDRLFATIIITFLNTPMHKDLVQAGANPLVQRLRYRGCWNDGILIMDYPYEFS